MAEAKADIEEEGFDEDGNPILPGNEDAEKASKISSKDNNDDDEEADPPKEPELGEDDVPVRKSAFQHIIARKNKTIEKLRSGQDGEEDEEGSDDKELTPEARGAVQAEVARAIEPVVRTIASKVDEDELQGLIESEPGAAKYEKRIRAYMNHPKYEGVPPSVIYHHLAFDDAEGTGARKKKAADHEAGQGRGGGRGLGDKEVGTNGIPTTEELNDMTDEEFEQLQNRARAGEFVKPTE